MQTREELVNELYKKEYWMYDTDGHSKLSIHAIADFIIADRKRCAEPLVKWSKDMNLATHWPNAAEAIGQALTLLGVEE